MPTIIGEKREGGINLRQGKNGILVREEPYHFTIQADSKWQDRLDILATPGLPTFGTTYLNGMSVKSMSAERDPEDSTRWHAVVTCSSEIEEDQNSQPGSSPGSDPTTWTPVATVSFEPYEEVMKEDVDGQKWVNSAKKPFETGFVRYRRIASVPFSQFEPISTTIDTLMDRCDTVNSTTYKGRAAKKLLLNIESAKIYTYNGFRCWRVDYVMKYKKDDWRVKQLDVGYGYYESGTYKPFLDSEGNQYLGNLKGTGAKVDNEATDSPTTLYFEQYEELDFNSFLRVLLTS